MQPNLILFPVEPNSLYPTFGIDFLYEADLDLPPEERTVDVHWMEWLSFGDFPANPVETVKEELHRRGYRITDSTILPEYTSAYIEEI